MEVMENSRSKQGIRLYDPKVLAPKDYFLGPVFAATRQAGPRVVDVGSKRYEIGGFHPLHSDVFPPAFDVRHARAIFTLLSFRDTYDPDGTRLVKFCVSEFCRRYARSNGGRYARDIRRLLANLVDSFVRVTDLNTEEAHSYRLIERVDFSEKPIRRKDAKRANDNQMEIWFNSCELSLAFYNLLDKVAELKEIDLDVFTSIRSPMAQAIYLYIPSRAYYHDEAKPFEITLTNLLAQVSFPIPSQKGRRRQIFMNHEKQGRSVLQQLDGVETNSGQFRVSIVETVDGTDYKLLAWTEKREVKRALDSSESKLVKAYLDSGRPPELLVQAFSHIEPLTDYEIDLMAAGKIEIEKNRPFFEQVKALLRGPRFDEILAQAKADELEGRKATRNQTARLIYRLMVTVGTKVKTPTVSYRRN